MKRELALLFLTSLGINTIGSSAAMPGSSQNRFVSVAADSNSAEVSHEEPAVGAPSPVFNIEVLRIANRLLMEKDLTPPSFGKTSSVKSPGGLWVTGNTTDAIERLQWIVGAENCQVLNIGSDGLLRVNLSKLVESAGREDSNPDGFSYRDEAPLIASYLSNNEGLLLLLQLTLSKHRYMLHIGYTVPTAAGFVPSTYSQNLDNNYDSRINPFRRNGVKLPIERPPVGFDSVTAINPNARWVNKQTNRLVAPGNLTFHELAEAYAKVDLGIEYLRQCSCPGAHDVAIEREERLLLQRPNSDVSVNTAQYQSFATERDLELSKLKKARRNGAPIRTPKQEPKERLTARMSTRF